MFLILFEMLNQNYENVDAVTVSLQYHLKIDKLTSYAATK